MTYENVIFGLFVVFFLFVWLFAVRMAWEAYCIKKRKSFQSWLGKDR
jgi:hypothetical protein